MGVTKVWVRAWDTLSGDLVATVLEITDCTHLAFYIAEVLDQLEQGLGRLVGHLGSLDEIAEEALVPGEESV